MSKVRIAFIFLCLLACIQYVADAQSPRREIIWDKFDVPHVVGHDMEDMYYGFGWAQMRNHANLILRLYGQARGKGAEYWGEGYVSSDKQVRLFNIPAISQKEYIEQDPKYRKYLDAFVKGINAYALAHPEAVNDENKQVLPVTAVDVMSHGIYVVFLKFVADEDISIAGARIKPGSNSYAIGSTRSASGNAMLVTNPHLPWYGLYTFFEAHLQGPGFNVYGVSLVGLPVLSIAFNRHLGWTHTVNPIDDCDRYELTVQGDGYLLDGAVQPFQQRVDVIKIKQRNGAFKEDTVIFRYSQHGPVIGIKGNKAYAIRIAGLENPHLFYQWHLMGQAQNWRQFESALKLMQLPMFNVIYADDRGNIFYLFDGNIPRRPEGDWKFWHGTVDGSYSKYIWHQDLRYKDLPKLFNPRTGFIQNANDPPWNCTYPAVLSPDKYPPYIAPRGMELRAQRAVNMIRQDSAITFEKLVDCKLSTEMEAANRFLGDLLEAVKNYPDSLAAAAADVMRKWDRSTDSGSRGAVLFSRWYDKLNDGMFANVWDPAFPTETPSHLKDPEKAVKLLALAAGEVLKDYDSLNVAWGDVYRFRMNAQDYPANGGSETYGVYRTIYFIKDRDKKYRAVAGDSYVAITEFGRQLKARVLLSYGNSSQPGNKHAGDQLLLLAQKKLRTPWLEKKDILANLEEREELNVK